MATREQTQKEQLRQTLASSRSTLTLPDPRQILAQGKNVLQLASRLPSSVQNKPARTLAITAAATCLLILLLKPRSRTKTPTKAEKAPVSRQFLGFALAVSQPLVRLWLTERARKWLQK
ncbi:MAG: hypothetical protein AAGC74_05005 [Verrucomicrobiota bacterium]